MRALVAVHKGRQERLRDGLERGGLEGRDLAFAFELVYGVARRERLLDAVLLGFAHRGLPKDPTLMAALRLGVYQLLFVAGMPEHAAVGETVALVRGNRGFANAILRSVARAVRDRPAREDDGRNELPLGPSRALELAAPLPEDEVARLAVLHSLPEWLARRISEQHGIEGLRRTAAAASATPPIFLRPAASAEPATRARELEAAGVSVAEAEGGRLLRWVDGASPFSSPSFAAGHFVVQDPTALAAAAAVPCGPGDRVVDLCAAPGTKTTLLAERVAPAGRVHAFDPNERRRGQIVENVVRLRLEETVEVLDSVEGLPPADCVLADVPCSNTGVLGRRVEVRARLTPATFEELPRLQRSILEQAVAMTRPGGHVVYSTCSIDREENEAVVQAAQRAAEGLQLVESERTLPEAGVRDGGYFAVLRLPG